MIPFLPSFTLDMLVTPLLTAVAGLFGAWMGARIALRRYQEERGFDRRTEWIERSLAGLKQLHDATGAAAAYHQMDVSAPEDILSAHVEAQGRLTDDFALLRLYASSALVSELEPLLAEYADRTRLIPEMMEADAPRDRIATELEHQMGILRKASRALVTHGRRHFRYTD